MKLNINKVAVILALSATLALSAAASAQESYTFGIVPQQSGSKLSRTWTPILQYLEKKTGYKLQLATTRNIPTFEKRLATGNYDVAYMNPYHYTRFHDLSGYEAFAKAKGKRLKGILVVQKDSPYQDMKDLDNKELAFPSNAFAANLVPRAVFSKMGHSIDAKYVSSHDSVYRNVAKGRYPAGGGVMRTFQNTSPEYRDQLRILYTTEGYTPHAFAAHPRMPKEAVQKIQQAMVDMDKDPVGKELLQSIQLSGIETGRNQEWDDVRALEIKD